MIKLMEPELKLTVTQKDREIVEALLKDCEAEYKERMLKETGRDYQCTLSIDPKAELNPVTDCGGVILISKDGRIVCNNTVASKLELVYEQILPMIRSALFPNKK